MLREAAQCSQISSIQSMLNNLAEDESRHAALAWQTAGWMLEQSPELRPVAVSAFEQYVLNAPSAAEAVDPALEAHGYLTPTQRHSVAVQTMRSVVTPCRKTLLS
jgi:hypothetical protein